MPVHPAASAGRLPSARSGHSCTALPAHLVARLSPSEDGQDGQDGQEVEEGVEGGEGLIVLGGCRGACHGEHGNREDSTLNDAHVPVLSAPPRWLKLLYLHVPSLQNLAPWLPPDATRVCESPAAGRAAGRAVSVVHFGPCMHALTCPTEITSEITSEIAADSEGNRPRPGRGTLHVLHPERSPRDGGGGGGGGGSGEVGGQSWAFPRAPGPRRLG